MKLIKRYAIVHTFIDNSGIENVYGPYDSEEEAAYARDTLLDYLRISPLMLTVVPMWSTT